jgi:predicted O-methyltransferase YrrM
LTKLSQLYSLPVIAIKYLRYLLKASNGRGHGIHSPFVYEFTRQVLDDRIKPESSKAIESLRARLRTDRRVLEVEDLGAGPVSGEGRRRTVADIARRAAKPPRYGRLLNRAAAHLGCRSALELGTSLGLTTCYLATVPGMQDVLTLEGARSIRKVAEENFAGMGLSNIRTIEGNFDQTLAQALSLMPNPDLVFIDGNHRHEPTIRYFEQCLAGAGSHTVLVFDDIHWSRGMEQAWREISSHPRVRCTIDLFFIGIVLFREEFRQPQHFTIRY